MIGSLNTEDLKEKLILALESELPGWMGQRVYSPLPEHAQIRSPRPGAVDAAVAVLIDLNEEPNIILIKRASRYQGDVHKGQISFPGGKVEADDDSAFEGARRETFEEIGLELQHGELLGKISTLYIPVSNFLVHPFIGIIDRPYQLQLQSTEVERVIHLPLTNILRKEVEKKDISNPNGLILKNVPHYPVEGETVWGATSMILSEVAHILLRIDSQH